ncbi:glycosyltransferase family 2 protein [Psychrobacter sp. I-STPA6b]|uniref:glycosyltransferase family 2 protein n=1 Tax=Psychrobacter sp. I-STPA6b TaxID=2585718 RepID=UPI001D0C8E7D|nr:glycosyltransferase family 2 protein [Psychrobacter sp. I-STPA6b]
MSIQPIYLSIILPTYNDADALTHFLPQVLDFATTLQGQQQVLVIDDGSRDTTTDVVKQMMSSCPASIQLQLISLSRNFGKESALSAGLAHANGQYIAMLDADGQHPLSVLQQMLTMMEQQPQIDMVAGIQANRPHESKLAKTLKSGFYHFIQDTRRYEIRPNAGDFRLMNQKVLQALLSLPERQRFMKGLYAWVGFHTVYLPFTAEMREAGESKFNYASLFELALVGITSFSQKPLRLISRMGFVVSLLAILYGMYIVLETLLFGNDVAGWATVAAGIMFSAGIQLICIGVIGEYIGRLYEEVKQRPLYLIAENISSHQASEHKQNDIASETNSTDTPRKIMDASKATTP